MTDGRDASPNAFAAEKPKVLIVEDEVLLRLELADFLEQRAFTVLQASTHAEAMRLFEAGLRIDVVVTDIDLGPGPNGLSLAAWLRENRPGLPVIVCSGRLSETADAEALADAVFAKPFDAGKLVELIRRVLSA